LLLHEKPFLGINGSGKHNNWSMADSEGNNLLEPGKTPHANLQFLTFLMATIKAVYKYSDLLRATVATAGNDHRLGANEAPPAIISVFLGEQLTNILNNLETNKKTDYSDKAIIDLGISKMPAISRDNSDRNRTSPFAFTGNKFEFRAVGSSANCSPAMIVLNTIVANQLVEFKKDVETLMHGNDDKKDEAIFKVIRNYIISSKKILFEGNGYGEEWVKEAKKRGLSNLKDTPTALNAYLSPKTKELFAKTCIFSTRELEARYYVKHEMYTKILQIEARVIGDLALNHIIPTAIKYQNLLLENVHGLKNVFSESEFKKKAKYQIELINEISEHVSEIQINVNELVEERKKVNKIEAFDIKSLQYCKKIKPYFDVIRYHADKLETLIDDELWPLPKYREMLFIK